MPRRSFLIALYVVGVLVPLAAVLLVATRAQHDLERRHDRALMGMVAMQGAELAAERLERVETALGSAARLLTADDEARWAALFASDARADDPVRITLGAERVPWHVRAVDGERDTTVILVPGAPTHVDAGAGRPAADSAAVLTADVSERAIVYRARVRRDPPRIVEAEVPLAWVRGAAVSSVGDHSFVLQVRPAARSSAPVDPNSARVVPVGSSGLLSLEVRLSGEASRTPPSPALWILLGAAALAIAALLTFVFQRLDDGVTAIEAAVREVTRGNLEHRVALWGEDRLGRLGRAFNEMVTRLDQRRREERVVDRHTVVARLRGRIVGELEAARETLESLSRNLAGDSTPRAVLRGASTVTQKLSRRLERLAESLPDDGVGASAESSASVDLRALVGEVLDALGARDREGLDVREVLPPALPVLIAPSNALRTVLMGIVDNSLRAMPDGGLLKVEADVVGDAVRVRIIDTGIGMSAGFRQHELFHPYSTGWRTGQSLGLSLYRARRAMRAMGGDLAITSRAGVGTRVTLRVPTGLRAAAPGESAESPEHPGAPDASNGSGPERAERARRDDTHVR